MRRGVCGKQRDRRSALQPGDFGPGREGQKTGLGGETGLQRRPPMGTRGRRAAERGGGRKGGWWLEARVQCAAQPLLEPCGPPALSTRRASTSKGETLQRCSECALGQCYGRPLLIPHTLGRVERASTASFRSIFGLWERWKKARWWRRVCVRFCAHDFPKSTSRAPAFPPCASVTLTPSLGLEIPGKGSAVLGPVSSVQSRIPLAWWHWGASATSGLGCLGLWVPRWGADRPG